jgi:hypothetical protein
MRKKMLTLKGKVVNKNRQPVPGLRVEAWDKDYLIDDLLGSAKTGKNGTFTIRFNRSYYQEICFDRKPDLYFKIYRDAQLLLSTENDILWNVSDPKVEVYIIIPQRGDDSNNNIDYAVRGIVSNKNRDPEAGLLIKVFDRNMRSEHLLGKSKTDQNGRYQINYTSKQFKLPGKKAADLVVKVFTRDGETPLYTPKMDEIIFSAPIETVFNVTLKKRVLPEENEFDAITRVITPLLENVSIRELQENDEARDITFLNKETGITGIRLHHLVVAHRLGAGYHIVPAFFYALLRKDILLKADLGDVLTMRLHIDIHTEILPLLYDAVLTDAKIIKRDINTAVKEMIVPARVKKELPGILAQLSEFKDKALEYHQVEKPRKVLNLITEFILADKISEAENLLEQSKHDFPAFLDIITSADFFKSKPDREQAKTNLALTEVLGFDELIIKGVKELKNIKKPGEIKKLAAMNRADWKSFLEESAEKIDVAGKPVNKKLIGFHASSLVRKMEKRFPSTAFTAQLQREKKPKLKRHNEIVDLLTKHDDFDLEKTDIHLFFKKKKIDRAGNEPLERELKTLQRVFKLIPHYGKTNALLERKIHSAQSIVAAGRTRFVNDIAPGAGITKREANDIFRRAEKKHTASMLIFGDLQDTMRAMDVEALKMPGLSAKLEAASKDFPNLKSLFQLTDLCACEHCRSVYSPAAYLVEILQFLDKRSVVDLTGKAPAAGYLAKDVLFKRRPDLGDIDLSCENATTPLPYIDLVCEILEEAVAPAGISFTFEKSIKTGAIPKPLLKKLVEINIPVTDKAVIFAPDVNGDYILRDEKAVFKLTDNGSVWTIKRLHQTHAAAAELAAAPGYVNTKAYENLAAAKFAFKLPFDLNHTEAQAYFSRFGISRAKLMDEFKAKTAPTAAEKLGLTEGERIIIIAANPDNQNVYWNAVVKEMKVVDRFLTKTGLTYAELTTLLQLKFIDPDNKIFIKHLELSCDTGKKEIFNLDNKALDRIHRFLRLKKKTGWEAELLDEVITQEKLGGGNLDDDCLIKMAALLKIKEQCGLKLDELVGCYGEIPHVELLDSDYQPLYQRIFLNKAKNGFIEEGLCPEYIDGSKKISRYKPILASCLQISEQDFDELFKALTDLPLNFENLSLLFAVTRLSKKLKLSIRDYLLYKDLTGLDVFSSPAVTLDFVRHVLTAASSPLKIADVKYMLRHEAANLAQREMPLEKITGFLQNLQSSYQEAYDAYRSPYNDDLTADEQKEGVKNLLFKLPDITEADANNFLKMVDGQWVSPPDPAAYIDEKLSGYFDTTAIKKQQSILATATPSDFEIERNALIQTCLESVSAYLYQFEKTSILTTQLATIFNIEENQVKPILDYGILKKQLTTDTLIDLINSPPVLKDINSTSFPDQYSAVRLLHKLLPFIASLELENPEIEWFLKNNKALKWFEWDSIPYKPGQSAADYTKYTAFAEMLSMAKQLTPVANPADAENPITFFQIAEMLLPGSTAARADFIEKFSLLTGWSKEDVDAVDAYLFPGIDNINRYRDIETWESVEKCVEHLRKLGVTVSQVVKFIKPVLTGTDTHLLRMALNARYEEDTWLSTLKEIMDSIRPQKRDALVAYLLAVNPEMKDENDLYDYFLVDVEMEACMPSSRIVQAHGTIQLFVQRCLMGLEPKAAADVDNDKSWDQWKWMRNYRVWEANRKVFLYPENWIEPGLLNDKSYLFSELENELLQDEVNEFTTEETLIRYLEKLDDIAFLEVVATYYQTGICTMHVFARTKGGDPAQYYYRKFEKERYWTPWEKVELDITCDHLLAFVRNNRLHLAWPLFSEETDPNQGAILPDQSNTNTEQSVNQPRKKLRIQIAVSEFANEKWKPPKISRDAITTPRNYTNRENKLKKDKYNLVYNEYSQQILVYYTEKKYFNPHYPPLLDKEFDIFLKGIFNITGCKGYPELAPMPQEDKNPTNVKDSEFFPDFKDAILNAQRYLEKNRVAGDTLSIRTFFSFFTFVDRLGKTPGTFRITYPHQFTGIDFIALLFELHIKWVLERNFIDKVSFLKLPLGTLLPYFFEDSTHAYTVIPGFCGMLTDDMTGATTPVKRTFSDILKFFKDIKSFIPKFREILLGDHGSVEALIKTLIADPDFKDIAAELSVYGKLKYAEQFKNLYHPLVCMLRKTLYKDGVPALMARKTQLTNTDFNFDTHYAPNAAIVPPPFPIEDLDFSSDGSYSSYNWELFYHIPLLIATRLSKDQKFEEALTWFHYMFNPTGTLEGESPQKYWVTKPFFRTLAPDYIAQRIDTLLYKIANPDTVERKELEFAIDEWRIKPFRPHTVARFRPLAYQETLLMKYIDNLVEWGDYMFRQDTMESITRATQLYILADKLLGPKPRIIPPPVKVPYQTYNQVEANLDAFGNALVELENILPDLSALPEDDAELPDSITLSSLYFCIPRNEKMLEYWDRISDRLFKIRHCQNIDGVERTLALFAPPIDPAMLVRAVAAGLDISSVLAGLNAPLPYYRFNVLSQKATQLAQEVRGLGNSLLQALEKKDAEALSLLRSQLEIKVLKAVRDMKQLQIDEAKEQIEVLKKTKAVTQERNEYYAGIERIIPKEQLNLDKLAEAQGYQSAAKMAQTTGAIMGMIPDFAVGTHGAVSSPALHATFGGSTYAKVYNAEASVFDALASMASYEASKASLLGGYDRREDDWKLQERLSAKELEQIDQQIIAAEIRKEISETDLKNHDLQIENAQKIDEFMRGKYTKKELYQWMIGQISSVYFRAYQLAYDVAKKAEHCYQHELGTSDTFLEYGYWDSMKKGLQSADHLIHDIKRMEVSYLDKNKREYELTKHVSLATLDPLALVKLRATGVCDFDIPEALFDMDHPGHYFRRIKSVSISLPCIAGPYTSVSAKLSLVSNKYRKNPTPADSYVEEPGNDGRFVYNVGAIQSIAASNSQNDSGIFELNFRDERYLPFEGTGAISSWRLELPKEIRQFDYNTISDVILHVKYTAREGGSLLGEKAVARIKAIIGNADESGLALSFSLKHHFTTEWHRFINSDEEDLKITIKKDHFPYLAQGFTININKIELFSIIEGNLDMKSINNISEINLTDFSSEINDEINNNNQSQLSIAFDKADDEEVFLVLSYTLVEK